MTGKYQPGIHKKILLILCHTEDGARGAACPNSTHGSLTDGHLNRSRIYTTLTDATGVVWRSKKERPNDFGCGTRLRLSSDCFAAKTLILSGSWG